MSSLYQQTTTTILLDFRVHSQFAPTKVVTTDVYESFAALPDVVRLRYGEALRAELTPEVEALL